MPPHALRLSTYAELDAYVRAFAAGHSHLLLLFGPPGVGKSRAVRRGECLYLHYYSLRQV
jgi:hypothetical protein